MREAGWRVSLPQGICAVCPPPAALGWGPASQRTHHRGAGHPRREAALIEIGGQALLEDAQDEAGAYVDQHYPWDGRGDEPAERESAYCAVLWQRADLARSGTEAT